MERERGAPDIERVLSEFDLWSPDHERLKWEAFAYARQECPVPRTSSDGGFWLLTRYEDVRRVLEDPATFSSRQPTPRPSPVPLNPLDVDPPFQVELRRILNPHFSRAAILSYEADFRARARDIVGSWAPRGEVELVREFSIPFVSGALARLVLDESDEDKMVEAGEKVVATALDGSPEAFHGLAMLASEYVARANEDPAQASPVLRAIVTGTVGGGRRLTPEQQLGALIVLFIGGLDTTRGAIASIAYHIARDPTLEARVRDPGWIRQDMEEFIRVSSPVACLTREATVDVEVGGASIKAGDRLQIRYDSANYDETRFDQPSKLVFEPPRRPHVAFGLGVHRCLGMHLARVQIAIAFEELFRRVTCLRLADAERVTWAPGITNGPEDLHLTFDRYEPAPSG